VEVRRGDEKAQVFYLIYGITAFALDATIRG
jgi:hypothetical protein